MQSTRVFCIGELLIDFVGAATGKEIIQTERF